MSFIRHSRHTNDRYRGCCTSDSGRVILPFNSLLIKHRLGARESCVVLDARWPLGIDSAWRLVVFLGARGEPSGGNSCPCVREPLLMPEEADDEPPEPGTGHGSQCCSARPWEDEGVSMCRGRIRSGLPGIRLFLLGCKCGLESCRSLCVLPLLEIFILPVDFIPLLGPLRHPVELSLEQREVPSNHPLPVWRSQLEYIVIIFLKLPELPRGFYAGKDLLDCPSRHVAK